MSETPSVIVVGSVAVDWIITPTQERPESVGGSATYFSMSASYHCPVGLVGVVGNDFPAQATEDLRAAKVDLTGLEVVEDGLTFRWKGRYHDNMNDRDTLETHLNVFEEFQPKMPEAYRDASVLFLANIQPDLQLAVLDQMNERPRLVGLDTMNLWIDIASDSLREIIGKVDVLIINEEEALQLTGEYQLLPAARRIQDMGPRVLVIKRGEYGALAFGPESDDVFATPALLLESVDDPTGAGDSFAGGFMGYLAGQDKLDAGTLRRAVVWGTVMASFCVQGFSYDAINRLERSAIDERYERFRRLIAVG
jgi:sugar/nucleoside kinase (ribokinase family)